MRMALKLRWVVDDEKMRQTRRRGTKCSMKVEPQKSLNTPEMVYRIQTVKATVRVKLRTCDDVRKKTQDREENLL